MVDTSIISNNLVLIENVVKAIAIVLIGFVFSRVAGSITQRTVGKKVNPHVGQISKKIVSYIIIAIALVTALDLFIEVSTLIAAAGIAGIAIGMAAQRSVSNIISGLFLLADQPFEVGDAVDIGGNAGVVLDISLFSTRLRTFDNKYLRIPNDTVANAKITNLSFYDIRRIDIPVGVAYKSDVGTAVEVLTGVVADNKNVLAEPEPQVLVSGFGDSSIDITVRVWVQRTELFAARTELIIGIKSALESAGIEIPFPYRTLTFDEGELERLKK
jgi:small-conductance mechanosensitive channel